MLLDRSEIRPGMRMVGAAIPASARDLPQKGDFLIGGALPFVMKSAIEKSGTLAMRPGLYALPGSDAALAIRLDAICRRLKDLAAQPVPPGVGQKMHRDLERLMRDRGLEPDGRPPLPLAPPCTGPQLVKGIASRVAIDSAITMVTPNALYWDPDQLPPLRLKHGEVCGEILSLAYTFMGDELEIAARIDHPEAARMPAFSVAFTPCAYEVQALHVRVLSARLDEVEPDRQAVSLDRACHPSLPDERGGRSACSLSCVGGAVRSDEAVAGGIGERR